MAYTLTAAQIDDTVVAAVAFRIPTLVDNVYNASVLLNVLDSQERITARGGHQIEQPYLFGKAPGGSYSGSETLDTTSKKTTSMLQLKWKQYYSTLSIDGATRLQSQGYDAVFDLVDIRMQSAELRLKDDMGKDLYLDGTGNNSKALDGFQAALITTGSYGGINVVTDAEGTVLQSNVDTVGGVVTLPAVQKQFGLATHSSVKPNLILATQDVWTGLWNRLQPQQRFPVGALAEQIAQAGFSTIMFNGVPVVVDESAPSGWLLGVNTEYLHFVAHETRANIEVEGPIAPSNQDAKVWKLMWMGNLIVAGPRMMFRMTGLTS